MLEAMALSIDIDVLLLTCTCKLNDWMPPLGVVSWGIRISRMSGKSEVIYKVLYPLHVQMEVGVCIELSHGHG